MPIAYSFVYYMSKSYEVLKVLLLSCFVGT
jgi:hypothetical protein